MEHEGNRYTNCNWLVNRYTNCRVAKWTGRLENKRTNRDHPNYSIIKIC